LALRIVEIRRHGDHRVGDLFTEIVFRRLLELLQDHRRDLGRRVLLATHRDARVGVLGLRDAVRHALGFFRDLVELAAHEPLDREHGVFRVGHGLAFRDLANKPLAVLAKAHDGRRGASAFLVDDDDRLAVFHDRDHGVRGAEVDSDHSSLTHLLCPPGLH